MFYYVLFNVPFMFFIILFFMAKLSYVQISYVAKMCVGNILTGKIYLKPSSTENTHFHVQEMLTYPCSFPFRNISITF